MLPSPISADAPSEGANMRRLEFDKTARNFLAAVRGYRPPAEPPAPATGTWGDPPPMPSVLAQAAQESRQSGELGAVVRILATDPKDRLAAALASLGRAFMARDS
jgi:hypothetical protein